MPSTVRVRTSRPERPVVIRRRPPPNARPDRHRRQDENAARAPCPRGVSFGPPRLRPGRGSARRQRPTDFLVAGGDPERHAQPKGDRAARADERKQPDNRCRNERRTHTRDDRSERAARRVDISKLPGHEVLRLREPYDDRRRRQRKSKQCKHVYPLVTVLRQWPWRPYGPVSRPVSRPPNPLAFIDLLSSIHRMRAAVITRPGGPEVLEIREVDPPRVGPDDLLVRVRASGLNRADIHQRKGGY